MSDKLIYTCITPEQSDSIRVFSFVAKAEDIKRFARIDRISRNESGELVGFQRPQIAGHIREIKDYLNTPDSILPNPIVIAFLCGVELERLNPSMGRISIDVSDGPTGYIVDGQQRFIALSGLSSNRTFEVFVSGFLCGSLTELQKQFILINNTRPLPKALIYELLPKVNGLPDRMSSRSTAAKLTEFLNYRENSSIRGLIYQQTNPYGVIRDTAIQKLIMNSLADGALRPMFGEPDFMERAFRLLSNYFKAVQFVFASDWNGHTPKTSRLLHGAGIVSMGYVMESLYSAYRSDEVDDFEKGLRLLEGKTAWTEGVWEFGPDDRRKWDSIQYVPKDTRQLAQYLVSTVKKSQ
ncbi:MAG: DGQHR domain-containing protein DpdB [Syntrophobacter sp.]